MNFVKITQNGQVTIPKIFRSKFDTEYYACELEEGAVVFRPVKVTKHTSKKPTEVVFYENGDDDFGLYFPKGIAAKDLLKKLKKAHGKVS